MFNLYSKGMTVDTKNLFKRNIAIATTVVIKFYYSSKFHCSSVYVCASSCASMHVTVEQGKDVRSPRAGVTGSCKPHNMGA